MDVRADPIKLRKRLHLMFGLIYIIILALAAYLLLPDYWYLWLIMALVVLMRVISWTSKKKKYQCSKCKTIFFQEKRSFSLVPKADDLYGSEKSIRCPKCGSGNVVLVEEGKR